MSATAPVGWVLPTATVARARQRPDASVDLYWIPLGAGDASGLVSVSGWFYERLTARRAGRRPGPLFHSALLVRCGGATHAVEMAPVWGTADTDRGVVGEGPVGLSWLGASRLFRYEVRCWRNGRIPDLGECVGGPRRLSSDDQQARRLLSAMRDFPLLTWGRDERRTGDMWNSNSLVSWLLVRSGHDISGLEPPEGGRAPGWAAGVELAATAPGNDERGTVTPEPGRLGGTGSGLGLGPGPGPGPGPGGRLPWPPGALPPRMAGPPREAADPRRQRGRDGSAPSRSADATARRPAR